jgi:multiple antibiotic resistance protein
MAEFTWTALASVLAVVDPLGTLPAYVVMTANETPARRDRAARLAALVATLALAGFAAVGNALLRLLGLTMPAFQVAGGLILFLVALDMLRAQRPTKEDPGEVAEGAAAAEVAVTPLAVPMLAGPASLSTVALLMSRARDWAQAGSVYLAIVVTGVLTYAIFRSAGPIERRLGQSGIHVFSRVLGLILAGVAVQFVFDGLRAAGVLPPAAP